MIQEADLAAHASHFGWTRAQVKTHTKFLNELPEGTRTACMKDLTSQLPTSKPAKFKKVRTKYKKFMIHQVGEHEFNLYTLDEWECGEGYRSIEWEAGSMEEAKQWIDCY